LCIDFFVVEEIIAAIAEIKAEIKAKIKLLNLSLAYNLRLAQT
jgi:hypothetical protein